MPGDSGTALPNKAICCERGLHAPGAAGGLRRQWDVQEGHGGDVGSGYRGDTLAAHIGVPVPMVPLRCPRIAYWHWVRGPGLPRGGASLIGSWGSPSVGWHCPHAWVYSSRLIPLGNCQCCRDACT